MNPDDAPIARLSEKQLDYLCDKLHEQQAFIIRAERRLKEEAHTLLHEVLSGCRNAPVHRARELLKSLDMEVTREDHRTYETMREELDTAIRERDRLRVELKLATTRHCGFCHSFDVETVGMGYWRCRVCGKTCN